MVGLNISILTVIIFFLYIRKIETNQQAGGFYVAHKHYS